MIKIDVNSVKGKLINCPIKIEKEIYKLCSYRVFNFQFSDAYLNGYWDGYVRKYSIKTHTFPSGLLYRLIIFLKKKGLKVEVNDTRKKLVWTE